VIFPVISPRKCSEWRMSIARKSQVTFDIVAQTIEDVFEGISGLYQVVIVAYVGQWIIDRYE
jgi:hypothetical protein